MGAEYVTVQWNRQKKRYDLILGLFIALIIGTSAALNIIFFPEITFETLIIRVFGITAIVLLHIILSIGPLSRISRYFMVLLYNRRHMGVTMFVVAAIHGLLSLMQFHSFGNINPIKSLFISNMHYGSYVLFPFQTLGFMALIIIAFMAATGHDFWLKTLTPSTWTRLHKLVYLAYIMLLFHVLLGSVQNESIYPMSAILGSGALVIGLLHIVAYFQNIQNIKKINVSSGSSFIVVGKISDFPLERAIIFEHSNQKIAIFNHENKLSAVSNVCRHQGGPVGEGKIIEGCITCPWHGYQYYPHNGCSPPPFEEKLETYQLNVTNGIVYVDPNPFQAGTPVEPVSMEIKNTPDEEDFYVGWEEKSPKKYLKTSIVMVLFFFASSFSLVSLWILSQNGFVDSYFDYGRQTEFTGVLYEYPAPMLQVINENGRLQSIPLVNLGKFGVQDIMNYLHNKYEGPLNEFNITLKGTRIQYDGRTWLELTDGVDAIVRVIKNSDSRSQVITTKGEKILYGEIVDPKCFFGVMKPGFGKVHLSCAVRCISGGIPPILVTSNNADSYRNYYFMTVTDREKINNDIVQYVGMLVAVKGEFLKVDDWNVLEINPVDINIITSPALSGTNLVFQNCNLATF